jgi:hypothetical protein
MLIVPLRQRRAADLIIATLPQLRPPSGGFFFARQATAL